MNEHAAILFDQPDLAQPVVDLLSTDVQIETVQWSPESPPTTQVDIAVLADEASCESDAIRTLAPSLNQTGIIIVAADPVDAKTNQVIEAISGTDIEAQRVIGIGTAGDTLHFRRVLADRLQISARDVQAFIVGISGRGELPLWSSVTVAGVPLPQFQPKGKRPLTVRERSTMLEEVRGEASDDDAAAASRQQRRVEAVMTICRAVLRDEHAVLSVSSRHESIGQMPLDRVACFSMPTVIGRSGIVRVINEMPLNPAEVAGLQAAADRAGNL